MIADMISDMISRRILLVGLGKASWGFHDGFEDFSASLFQTHTHSILELETFCLIGGVDVHEEISKAWGNRFLRPQYNQLPNLDFNSRDIVVISTDIKNLSKSLIEVVYKYPNPLILIEKPVVNSTSDLSLVKSLSNKEIDRILVNFPRNYQPETELLKIEIDKLVQEFGSTFLHISAEYSKGFLNTGSHLVVLLKYLFAREVKLTPAGKVFGEGIAEGFDFAIHTEDSFIEGLATYNPEIAESTFSFKVQIGEYFLYYNGGGADISIINTATNAEQKFESTRDTYQLEVYRYLGHDYDPDLVGGVRLKDLFPTLENMLFSLMVARERQ